MQILQSERPRPLDLLAVGPDGLVAAACSTIGLGGDVEVWTVTTGAIRHRTLVSEREARGLAFVPDGQKLLVGEPTGTVVFDLVADDVTAGPERRLGYPEFALPADGRRLLITEADIGRGTVSVMGADDGTKFRTLWSVGPEEFWYKIPAISSDGNWVAVARRGAVHGGEVVQIREAATGKLQSAIPSHPADLAQQLAFMSDGAKLMVRPVGRTIRVFDTATGQPAGEFVHPGRPYVTGMAVHPNGTPACSRTNGTVCLWDVDNQKLLRTLDWKLGKLVSVAFAPDGSLGAAGTEDGQVVVWDVDE